MGKNKGEEDEVKETNAGVKKKGELEEVAEFAEEVEEAMKDEDMDEETVEEFDKWRPRKDEKEKDIKEKTVKSAVKEEEKIEENFEGVKKDVEDIEKEAEKVPKKVKKGQAPHKEVKNISKDIFDPVFVYGTKLFKWLEVNIYKRFMLYFNDFYFNSEELSADLRKERTGKYDLDIDIKDDKKRDDLKKDIENLDKKND